MDIPLEDEFAWLQHRDMITHWGRVMQICISKLTIIGLDNGLSPGRRQAIIWINEDLLPIGTLGTNFNEIVIEIQIFLLKKMHKCIFFNKNIWISKFGNVIWRMLAILSWPQCAKHQFLQSDSAHKGLICWRWLMSNLAFMNMYISQTHIYNTHHIALKYTVGHGIENALQKPW